jgi:hypothetical protein
MLFCNTTMLICSFESRLFFDQLPVDGEPRPGCDAVQCVELLLAAHPEAVFCPDDEGDVPLQCAFSHCNISLPLLECLLKATFTLWPPRLGGTTAVAENALTGQLPLHTACANGIFSPAILDAVMSYDPKALWHYDKEGRLPLHVALMQPPACPVPVLRRLLYHHAHVTCPLQSCSTVTTTVDGTPALFVACEYAVHSTGKDAFHALDTIRFLVEQSPELFA